MRHFLPFLLLLLGIAFLMRVDLYFSIVWFLVGLYGLSWLWMHRAVRRLRVRRTLADHAFTGDEVKVALRIENAGRLPIPWLEIEEAIPLELTGTPFPPQVITLGGRSVRDFNYTLKCRRRGYYPLGPLEGKTGDVLGIKERVVNLQERRYVTVYPRVVPLGRLGLPTRSARVTLPARTPLFEDSTRIVGVRDYRPGDSPRRIHWTSTARTGRLVVKQYQPSIARETLICLDLDVNDYPIRRHEATESAIVVAASLASHMIVQERLPVGLATEARDPAADERRRIALSPRSERSQLTSVLEVLARVQAGGGGRFADLLRQESVNLAWGSTMVVVTGQLDDDLAETLVYLNRSGHAIAVILVQPTRRRGEAPEQVQLVGVPVHRVWTDRELMAV